MCLFYLLFLNSANPICRGTAVTKYFRESILLRDNESRLYFAVFNVLKRQALHVPSMSQVRKCTYESHSVKTQLRICTPLWKHRFGNVSLYENTTSEIYAPVKTQLRKCRPLWKHRFGNVRLCENTASEMYASVKTQLRTCTPLWKHSFGNVRLCENTASEMYAPVKSQLRISTPSEDSDQPAHPYQSALSAWWTVASLVILNVPSEDSDQPARMRRLIWIFTWRTCPKVRFLTCLLFW